MRFLGGGIGHQQHGSTFTGAGVSTEDDMDVDEPPEDVAAPPVSPTVASAPTAGEGEEGGSGSSDEEDPERGYYPSADEDDEAAETAEGDEDEGAGEADPGVEEDEEALQEGSEDEEVPDLGPEDGEGDHDADDLEYAGFAST